MPTITGINDPIVGNLAGDELVPVDQADAVTRTVTTQQIADLSSGSSGINTLTPFAVVVGGSVYTDPLHSVSGVGTSTQVLTSNGAGAFPTWQDPTGGGGGSGTKTYGRYTPMTSCPFASAYATLDTRNSIPVLDFSDASVEAVFWVDIMPEAASLGSGLKVTVHWMATSATSGDVAWGVQFEKMGSTDEDSDSWDTAATNWSTTSGTSGVVNSTTITNTNIDSIAAQSAFRIRVYRDTDDVTHDTMTGDAELVSVELWSAA